MGRTRILLEMETETAGQGISRVQKQNNDGTIKEETKERDIARCVHVKSEADGDNFGGTEPADCLDAPLLPDHLRSLSSDSDTDDSADWGETSDSQSHSNSVENPRVHVKEETDDADHESLTCSGWGKKCLSEIELTRHRKSCHGPLTCSLRGKGRGTRKKLWTRMSAKKPFTCSQCGRCFSQKGNLKRHMRIHTRERCFVCSHCSSCFEFKNGLIDHLKQHYGEKPFICSECGICFSQEGNLKIHKKIHTGEKPYVCSHCGKCFTHKSDMKKHMRIHTGEKPFNCCQCGKCFSRLDNLRNHMKIHSGEKSVICSHCGKCFTLRSGMTRHLRIHTAGKHGAGDSECQEEESAEHVCMVEGATRLYLLDVEELNGRVELRYGRWIARQNKEGADGRKELTILAEDS
ncbi:zinc finger protein 501-like isoform X7 [Synchiropus splendidus]|uniref:zinc finger protein 501-like isoform X7 n=1 Tax=Synchiropus splendidus TaxID=270530 RepID=UPI00237E1109|nr:zinc finger protein 501-like isoform X7 [Synchiropus splendidus]